MKKLYAALLTTALAASVLAGCGKDGGSQSGGGQSALKYGVPRTRSIPVP
ncbi:hypothetical protein [Acetatifactor muris]|nr:hypothetical protein [Acetatifactor muris]